MERQIIERKALRTREERGGSLWGLAVGLGCLVMAWGATAALAQGEGERDIGGRPETPAERPAPPAPPAPRVAPEPPAAPEAVFEEPETVVLPTGEALDLTFSHMADRRPVFSPDGQWLAFETDRDGQWEIYRMHLDGSHQERLTRDGAADRSPSYSPDGRYLAFQSNRKPGDRRSDLYLLDLELGEEFLVSDDEADEAFPRFSPDGRWLLYTASPDGNTDLYRRPLNGSPPVPGPAERLTDHEANDVWGHYSADGESVVYFSRRDDDNDELYRLDLASRESERLTVHPSNDFVPALSPDGRWLAFASNRRGAGLTRLFILDLEGKLPLAELEEEHWAGEPTFSPDGRYLAFASNRSRNYEIFLWEIPER